MAQKSSPKEPKITLTSASPCFRAEQFAVEEISGEAFVTMRQYENKEFLNESFYFSLFDTAFIPLSDEKNAMDENGKKMKKYLCAPNKQGISQFYILLEQGETGFEVSNHAFICDMNIGNGGITIDIKSADDAGVLEKLVDALVGSGNQSQDVFFDSVSDGLSDCHSNMQALRLEQLEKTDFIRILPDSSQRKLGVLLNSKSKFDLIATYQYKQLAMSANGSDYFSKEINDSLEIGTLLCKRDDSIRNRLDIVKITKFVHDFNSEFFAVAELVAVYPQDAERIHEMYPAFYDEYCVPTVEYERRKLLKQAKSIAYLKAEQQIGDGIIHIQADVNTNEISVAMGEHFHFALDSCKGMGHYSKGNGKIKISQMPVLCSVIECERRFRLVYYRVVGFVKHQGQYYAEARFQRASNWLDSLESKEVYKQDGVKNIHVSTDKNAVSYAALMMYRNILKPIKLDKGQLGVNLQEMPKVQCTTAGDKPE